MQGHSHPLPPAPRKRGRGDTWEPLHDEEVTTTAKRRRTNAGSSYTTPMDLVCNTASTLLNTAAEAVVFCTVLGMAAYRIWSGQEQGDTPAAPSPVVRRRSSIKELHPSSEATDRPPAYDSIYLVSNDQSSIRDPYRATKDRFHGSRRPQYPASSNATRKKRIQIISSPKRSPISTTEQETPSPAFVTMSNEHSEANDAGDDDDDDELFASMSSRVQAMIQQGNQALQYSSTAAVQGVPETQQASTDGGTLQRRRSMPAERVSMIPFPSAATPERRERGHRARASMG